MEDNKIIDLVTAFSYKLSFDRNFYLKKENNKVIEVSILDYSLVSDCKDSYSSGLDMDEEREVKEAIIATEKKIDTHVVIPRIEKNERIEIMRNFILQLSDNDFKLTLENNLKDIIELEKGFNKDIIKKGLRPGFSFDDLVYNKQVLADKWYEYYFPIIKEKALNWLMEINKTNY